MTLLHIEFVVHPALMASHDTYMLAKAFYGISSQQLYLYQAKVFVPVLCMNSTVSQLLDSCCLATQQQWRNATLSHTNINVRKTWGANTVTVDGGSRASSIDGWADHIHTCVCAVLQGMVLKSDQFLKNLIEHQLLGTHIVTRFWPLGFYQMCGLTKDHWPKHCDCMCAN